jgi:hypothetical protein
VSRACFRNVYLQGDYRRRDGVSSAGWANVYALWVKQLGAIAFYCTPAARSDLTLYAGRCLKKRDVDAISDVQPVEAAHELCRRGGMGEQR